MKELTVVACLMRLTIAGFVDLLHGLYQWRLWHLLGITDLRHRYSRSRFGQLWIVVSTAVMVGSLSAVWALLWNQSIGQLKPTHVEAERTCSKRNSEGLHHQCARI